MIRRLALSALIAASAPAAADAPTANLRGWWINPSPGNVSLLDGKTEIEIARQGAGQPEGPWPKFPASRWVRSGNGHYGYGCVSLVVVWDGEQVSRIVEARALPLTVCRRDARLRRAERQAR